MGGGETLFRMALGKYIQALCGVHLNLCGHKIRNVSNYMLMDNMYSKKTHSKLVPSTCCDKLVLKEAFGVGVLWQR